MKIWTRAPMRRRARVLGQQEQEDRRRVHSRILRAAIAIAVLAGGAAPKRQRADNADASC
jgi:hypothetical protein